MTVKKSDAPGPVVHSWPDFLVSAPHTTRALDGTHAPETPYGLWHARRNGSLQSACGRSAVTWRYFWSLEFSRAGRSACPECSRVLSDGQLTSR